MSSRCRNSGRDRNPANIPLLIEEGWLRRPEKQSRSENGADGVVKKLSDHPVHALEQMPSALSSDGVATPPLRGGDYGACFYALFLLICLIFSSCARPELRVCADPNNLPFSNQRLEGFENKIADIIAKDLRATVRYTWWAQRRGFFRNTLSANDCDVVMGIPARFDLALPTRPYYRSSYVFLYRKDRGLDIRSFDDPELHRLKVGVQLVGDDSSNTPPAHALSNRNIIDNVVGYTLYGDYSEDSPPARIVDAVAAGSIDVAVVWGPLAGYFAKREPVPLVIVPVSPQIDPPGLPFVFDIAIGVRRNDTAFRDEIQQALDRTRPEIQRILEDYGIPTL
jgi:mxaJ protein